MKRLIALATLSLLVGLSAAQADPAPISVNEPITGEISAENYEQAYRYSGQADEIIIISMETLDLDDNLTPLIVLLDPQGEELVSYGLIRSAEIIWQLAEAGDYTILATRDEREGGETTGGYRLTVSNPIEARLGDAVEGEMGSRDRHYYAYRDERPFILSYVREGNFSPEVTINLLDMEISPGTLDAVGVMGGTQVTAGSIGEFEGGQTYLVVLKQALFDIAFGERNARYALRFSGVAPR